MKILHIIVLIAALFLIDETRAAVNPAPIPNSVRALKPRPGWACQANVTGWSCKDCSTMQSCNNGVFEYQITCAVQFPDRPYCNPSTGMCSADRNVCQEIETGMNCPEAGLYPDLESCSKYISCSSKGSAGISYNCMFDSVYNHSEKRCRTNANCYNVSDDCQGQYMAIAYRPDPSLYVICRGADTPMLRECGKNLIFNPALMSCEFQCTTEGHFANPNNSSAYYICVYNGTTLVKHDGQCVQGTVFNEATGNCITDNSGTGVATV